MTGPVTMDLDSKLWAVGFNDQDEALRFIKTSVDNAVFTENAILYKSNPFTIGPNMLRPLYIKFFGKRQVIYYKDYSLNQTITIPTVRNLDLYWATFTSLMNYLSFPRFLVIYRIA